MALARPQQELALDVPFGRRDSRNRLFRFMLIAGDLKENAGALAIRRNRDLRDVAQGDPRITQLAFNNYADLFFQRLAYPFPMMLFAPLLRHLFYIPVKNS